MKLYEADFGMMVDEERNRFLVEIPESIKKEVIKEKGEFVLYDKQRCRYVRAIVILGGIEPVFHCYWGTMSESRPAILDEPQLPPQPEKKKDAIAKPA
jgi:hypothetical protein